MFVDAFLGDFYMLVLSSIAHTIGLGLLSLSTPSFFGPCSEYKEECIGHIQKVLFFTALPLMAAGIAGFLVSCDPFYDLQSEALAKTKTQAPAETETQTHAQAEGEVLPKTQTQPLAETEAQTQTQAQGPDEDETETQAQASVEAEDQIQIQTQAQAPTLSSLLIDGLGLLMAVLLIICGGIAFPYIKPWSTRFGIPAICAFTATVLFLAGSSHYKHSKPQGSPLTVALRVFVAASTKDFQQVKNFKTIYNDDGTRRTSSLSWLENAAIKFPDQAKSKSWTLCTLHEVEDTKTGIRMVPMLLTSIGTGVLLSLGKTYFLEQANHMDRKLGSIKIQIPLFLLFHYISEGISQSIYTRLMKRTPISERYHAPIGIAVGMLVSVLCCITAALVETRRLHVIRKHGLLDNSNETIPMSVFSLLPQFLLLGVVEGLIGSGIKRCLTNQIPKSMHKYVENFKDFVFGLGSMANVLLVYVLGKVSETNNNPNWFQHTSNQSRLDRYYWTLAGLSAINLVVYTIVASFYKYQGQDDSRTEGPDAPNREDGELELIEVGNGEDGGNENDDQHLLQSHPRSWNM